MQTAWISLDRIARGRGNLLSAAKATAEREHWPKVFRTHEFLVLAPEASLARA